MNFSKLKEAALAAGIKEIEVYSETSKEIELSIFNDEVDSNVSSKTDVLAVRGVYNNQITTVYEENDSDEMIPSIVSKIIDNCQVKNSKEPFFIYKGDDVYPEIENSPNDYSEYTLDDKIELCLDFSKTLKEMSPYVTKVEVNYAESLSETSIINSNGLNLSRKTNDAYVFGSVVCEKDGDVKTGFKYAQIANIKDFDLKALAKEVVDEAVSSFGAESIPSGSYKVVLDKSVVRNLIGAFSSVFSADTVIKNMSFLKDKLNTKVFGDNISLIDDPLSKEANSQLAFDDEGVATSTKSIVENGVLKTYFHNLKTASMMNTKSTGNGFKASVSSSVGVSPCNLYLKPGKLTLEEIFKEVGDGVYITSLSGLHAGLNQISGSFNLQAGGFSIENGKISKPVTLIILSGTLQDMLNNVSYLGSDFEFKRGVGAPSIAIKSLAISGK